VQFRVRELYTLSALKRHNAASTAAQSSEQSQPALAPTAAVPPARSVTAPATALHERNGATGGSSRRNGTAGSATSSSHNNSSSGGSNGGSGYSIYHHRSVRRNGSTDPAMDDNPLPNASYYNHYYAHRMAAASAAESDDTTAADEEARLSQGPYAKPDVFGDADVHVSDLVQSSQLMPPSASITPSRRKEEQSSVAALGIDVSAIAPALLTHGYACHDFQLTCRMAIGCVWIDGCTTPIEVGFGDRVTFRVTQPIHWVSPIGPDQQPTDGWQRVTNRPRPSLPQLLPGACTACGEVHSPICPPSRAAT
jgi:hypothetical protein